MKKTLVMAGTGVAGLVASGLAVSLLAFPADAGENDLAFKREQDTPDIVLVSDDDDDDPDDRRQARQDDDTNTAATVNTANTRTANTGNSRDRSRTGARSGRDDSRSNREVRDWTKDGPGGKKRDWSRNHTNDRSRHNTRG